MIGVACLLEDYRDCHVIASLNFKNSSGVASG